MSEQKQLEQKVQRLERTVATLIAWIAQSAGSPISVKDANELLRMLDGPTQ